MSVTPDFVRPPAAFDPATVPLAGMQLIEASAGTGKTYTLSALYLRLLLERGLPVESILVVTFTDAAAAELKHRIRARLCEARARLVTGHGGDELLQRLLAAAGDTARCRQRLDLALASFDLATIGTMHGWCMRVLHECAFETGADAACELTKETDIHLAHWTRDVWRQEMAAARGGWRNFLCAAATPEQLAAELGQWLHHPGLRAEAPPQPEVEILERRHADAWQAAARLWRSGRAAVIEALSAAALNQTSYQPARVAGWVALLERWFDGAPAPADKAIQAALEYCTPALLTKNTKKNFSTPTHPFFAACAPLLEADGSLQRAYAARWAGLRAAWFQTARAGLTQRLHELSLRSYDELLYGVDAALRGAGGAALAALLAQRHPALLIDEFQDTDALQYGLFARVHRARADGCLVLVGDPKQAIYRFRGADLYTYLRARADAARTHGLHHNYRSVPSLIAALNALWCGARPFLAEEIPCPPAVAALPDAPLVIDGEPQPACVLWRLPGGADGKALSKVRARARIGQAVAQEIACLLRLAAEGRATLGERALRAADIAVLVRTHVQGARMQAVLTDAGVASVRATKDSVFCTDEAAELILLLHALLRPQDSGLLHALLATRCMDRDGAALARLGADDAAYADWQARCADHAARWQEQGFYAMFQRWLTREGVLVRLLGLADGERRAANLLHLAELLHAREIAGDTTPRRLLDWLCTQRAGARASEDEHQLRLESDAARVHIVTLHGSKGLEYGIVFCPELWEPARKAKTDTPVVVHEPLPQPGLVLDCGTERLAERHARAARENLAEELRLAYVAMTRAKHRLYLACGHINDAGRGALSWLLHRGAEDDPEAVAARCAKLSDADRLHELQQLAARAGGNILLADLPDDPVPAAPVAAATAPPPSLTALTVRAPAAGFRLYSYTGLSQMSAAPADTATADGGDHDLEPDFPAAASAPDADTDTDAEAADMDAAPAAAMMEFPAGVRAGRALHGVLEHWDFSRCDAPGAHAAALHAACARELRVHGLPVESAVALADLVQRTLTTPLPQTGIRLCELPGQARCAEWEFHLHVGALDAVRLRSALARAGYPAPHPEPHGGASGRGFLKGFVDLVFAHGGRYWLVDYKSNRLGPAISDYAPERLHATMAAADYFLQAVLYSHALHRDLQSRLPDYDYDVHFGGVFYLFPRGMDARFPGHGVYFDRPPRTLIDALCALLAPAEYVADAAD